MKPLEKLKEQFLKFSFSFTFKETERGIEQNIEFSVI